MSIQKRIYLSFGTLVFLFLANAVITSVVLKKNKKLSSSITHNIVPSLQNLNDFQKMVLVSRMYATNWIFMRSQEDEDKLFRLNHVLYPSLKSHLDTLARQVVQKKLYDSLRLAFIDFETLIHLERRVMNRLNTSSDYNDPVKMKAAERILEAEILPRTTRIIEILNKLIEYEKTLKASAEKDLERSSAFLLYSILSLAVLILLAGVILSLYLSRIIIRPLNDIQLILEEFGKGNLRKLNYKAPCDEIGKMIEAVNRLSGNLSAMAFFATEIGKRNFEAQYTPLSQGDFLGKALITMKENLSNSEKNLEEATIQVQESEKRFRSLIENSSDGISIVNPEGECIYLSPSTEKIIGYTANELLFQKSFLFIHPEDQEASSALMERVLKQPAASELILLRGLHKNGTYRWLECVVSNFTTEKMINGIVINFRDVTERQEAEEILRRQNETLKKTNMELDRFVYSVSHDLRAPLTSMTGIIGLLEDEIQEETAKDYLILLETSIKKLDSFILEILDYSRNSRTDVSTEKISFSPLIHEIIENLRYLPASKNIDFRINISEKTTFFCDKSRLFVIMNNLISNAIKYHNTLDTEPFVEISILSDDKEAKIEVKDNGIGILKDYHDKIFDMFYRVSHKSDGSGLGLYIVKETVDKLNGNIAVESEPGKGSRFVISLRNTYSNYAN